MKNKILAALKLEHVRFVSETSGNMGGHLAVRKGRFSFDEETLVEHCDVCDLILKAEGKKK